MKLVFIFSFLLLMKIKGESGEYYDCLNPYKNVSSPSDCLSITIPDSDGYKCCSMKISYQNRTSYNCFPLESNYTKNKEILEKYMTKRSLSPYLSNLGGQMEIECGGDIQFIKEYEAVNDEFNKCYNGHIFGTNDEYACIENNISIYERKCCFVESSKINNETIIDDKRCYMIKEEYFNGQKNLDNYLIDELNVKSLKEIKDIKLKIKCKNYETFYFISENLSKKETETKEEESNAWIVAIIVILVILIILVTGFLIYRWKRRQSISMKNTSWISIKKIFE